MWTGVQFEGSLGPNGSASWFTFGWPATWHVYWYMIPTTIRSGNPELDWSVGVEKYDDTHATYWLTVNNRANIPINFEGRFAVLN